MESMTASIAGSMQDEYPPYTGGAHGRPRKDRRPRPATRTDCARLYHPVATLGTSADARFGGMRKTLAQEAYMRHVRVAIYEMKPNTFDTAIVKARNELASSLRQQPGFVSYQVAKLDGTRSASFAVFETRAAAENGARVIEEWVKKNMVKDVVSSQVHLGELAIDSIATGAQSDIHA
jgi:hypothetical protein